MVPLTLSPFPLSFPPDRLELEAAQKFLERAAVENLVRAIRGPLFLRLPILCLRAFPPSRRPRPREPTPPHPVPLSPNPVQPNPAIGKPVGVSRPGPRQLANGAARRGGCCPIASRPEGGGAAGGRKGGKGRQVRLRRAACSARVGVGEPGLGAMWKLPAQLPGLFGPGPASSCPVAPVILFTYFSELYPLPSPLLCAHRQAWSPNAC